MVVAVTAYNHNTAGHSGVGMPPAVSTHLQCDSRD